MNTDIDFETWAEELFEFEYCHECHGDARHHEPWVVLGNWFAHCKFQRVLRRGGRTVAIRRGGAR